MGFLTLLTPSGETKEDIRIPEGMQKQNKTNQSKANQNKTKQNKTTNKQTNNKQTNTFITTHIGELGDTIRASFASGVDTIVTVLFHKKQSVCLHDVGCCVMQ
eukprot:TRINITY_DN211_c0_g2_i2.p2 TRINITY_DN211_c0_g2~~TRINITY_DN211_c0_g2_i2.p2  ORF type:complete len:103 (+),score=27.27 TRINITY_DN211_c0_g2_i2:198-506(+)